MKEMKGILQKPFKKDKKDGLEKKKELVFGGTIDKNSTEIPLVLEKCVEYLDATGLTFEGIFRKSGSLAQVNEYKAKFERGEEVDLGGVLDPHIVAGLLKMYVRELAEPLLTFELYDMFLAAVAIKDVPAKIKKIRQVLAFLPSGHLVVVKYLVSFLCRVSAHSSQNMMTPSNLAIVFAPNLLRPPYTGEQELAVIMEDTPYSNELLQIFVSHHAKIFKDLETEAISETKILDPTRPITETKQTPPEPKQLPQPKPLIDTTQLVDVKKSPPPKPLPPLPNAAAAPPSPTGSAIFESQTRDTKPLPTPGRTPLSSSTPNIPPPSPEEPTPKSAPPGSRRPVVLTSPVVVPPPPHRPVAMREGKPPFPTPSSSSSPLSARSEAGRQNRFATP